jgi:hypothetical protein
MKMKMFSGLAAATCLLALIAVKASAEDYKGYESTKANLVKGGDIESMPEGGFADEKFDKFWGPISPELAAENTYLTVTTEKAHSGKKSIKVALTNDTAEKWLAHPAKGPEFTPLYLHYPISPKRDVSSLSADTVIFSVWIFVEKGDFSAKFIARSSGGVLISGDVSPSDTGKWVQVKLDGQGKAGIKRSDIRLEIECKGEFTAYLDDFYYGPEPKQ